MNSLVTKRKALTVLLAVIAAVCLACALTISATTEKAFAQSGDGETPTERTPVVTYIIGDSTVTDESGFTFDEAANTYTYKDHAAGWSAALANSAELYNADEADANLVKVQLASDWKLTNTLHIDNVKYNVLVDLNSFDIDRGLNNQSNEHSRVFYVKGCKVEITDTSSSADGKITGGYVPNDNGAGLQMASGTFILSGGNITGNYARIGGGIRLDGGEIIINGGSITKNVGTVNSGGISLNFGSVTIHGGIISGNYSDIGGGILINAGTLKIAGGSIINNGAKNGHGGISVFNNPTIELSGTAVIKDNYTNKNFSETTENYNNGTIANLCIRNTSEKITVGKLEKEASIGFTLPNVSLLTSNYSFNNTDKNGITADPSQYFIPDNSSYNVILNADGEVQLTNQGALEWTVNGKEGTAIDHTGYYGTVFTYLGNQITGISLKQGETQISDITVKKAGSEGSINLSANPLTDAGTYYATATVKGIGTEIVQTKFTIVILPYNLESSENPNAAADGVTYTLSNTTGWTNGDGTYTNKYDGQAKTSPTASVSLNNNALTSADFTVSYLLNGEPVGELKEVGTYTVVITGTGNYTGTVYATELFIIEQNTETSYKVTWQYYDGNEWKNLADSDGAAFTYTSADYTHQVRVVLIAEGLETRYVYADGVTEYHLADGEDANDVAFDLAVGIDKDGETVILTAGTYALALNGTPNYVVAEQDTTSAVTVAPYNLANIVSGSTDTANINAALNNTTYNAQAKELSLTVSFVLNGNVVNLTDADYDYVVKYLKDGEEIEVEQFILGGTYKVYITSKNANFTGTPGVAGTFTINQANNRVTLNNIGNWLYGNYDERINHFEWNAAWLYDGTIAGTEQAYVYFTVMSDGEAVNETLTRFTKITDEIKAALNALDAGNYTLLAEADETASYAGAQDTVAFEIVKATNSFVVEPSVVEWKWNGFDKNINQLFLGSVYGNNTAVKTVKDGSGNAVAGLESFVEITDEIAAKLNALDAGSYTVTVVVADTANYSGLEKTVGFTVHKADNGWDTPLDIYSWTWGEYADDNGIVGTAISGGEVYCTITDRNTGNVIAGYEHIAVGTSLKDLPAGSYVLTGYVDESKNYAAYSSSFNFNVYKAQNAWTSLPGIQSWVAGYYDETENAVGGVAKHGTVSYKITDENGNVVTDLANAEVGKYTLTMTVEGTDNYEGLTYTATFNVFESRDLKGGEIAGITIASVVVAGLAAAVIVLLIKRRKTV